MTAALTLVRVASMPTRPERKGTVGRPSQLVPLLAQIREAGPGEAFQVTAEPLHDAEDAKSSRGGQMASRIRSGNVSGIEPGEFDAIHAEDGHVYVQYIGASGIEAAKVAAEKRAANKARKAAKLAAQAAVAAPVAETPAQPVQLANTEW